MKKIALTSLLTVFAAAGANAANIIDGNPLYMPTKGNFYSVTDLSSHSENTNMFTLGEEFGYGVTDKLAIAVTTDVAEDEEFDATEWGELSVDAKYRVFDRGPWKVDAMAAYGVMPVWGDHASFLDKDLTAYGWMLGVRGGYTTAQWTVAGHVEFIYQNTESFNWGDEGMHMWVLGVDGQYVINRDWNLVAGIEYTGLTDSWAKNAGEWTGEFGVNYNINSTMYVGAYVNAAMDHWKDDGTKGWEVEDGFGYGLKFGAQF